MCTKYNHQIYSKTDSLAPGRLHVVWPLKQDFGRLIIDMDEREIKMTTVGGKPVNWFLDLTVADKAKLPFTNISRHQIDGDFQGMSYLLRASVGSFEKSTGNDVFKMYPKKSTLILDLSGSEN